LEIVQSFVWAVAHTAVLCAIHGSKQSKQMYGTAQTMLTVFMQHPCRSDTQAGYHLLNISGGRLLPVCLEEAKVKS